MDTYTYQKTNRYFAQIADHMEALGQEELSALGAEDVQATYRGLFFSADKATLYRINYMTRLCTRIMAPLLSFDCHSTKYLYTTAGHIDWPSLFQLDQTFCISANVSNSAINHSQYAALCVKDAIVDQFRARMNERPNVERINPDIHINLHIDKNKATIYLDTSGGSLHRRGYRKDAQEAPMQENLAAAIVRLSEWDGTSPLHDPMCGSGTLICEAVMASCNIPNGYLRQNFGFEFLPDYDAQLWSTIKRELDGKMRQLPPALVSGSDISKDAIAKARANAKNVPGGGNIYWKAMRFQDLPALKGGTIICNPPYGKRIGRGEDLGALMKEFGDYLKQRCTGSRAFVYFGNRELIKQVGLRTKWKKPLKNGSLDGRLVCYELY